MSYARVNGASRSTADRIATGLQRQILFDNLTGIDVHRRDAGHAAARADVAAGKSPESAVQVDDRPIDPPDSPNPSVGVSHVDAVRRVPSPEIGRQVQVVPEPIDRRHPPGFPGGAGLDLAIRQWEF